MQTRTCTHNAQGLHRYPDPVSGVQGYLSKVCVCVCVVTGLSRQSVRRTEQDFQPVEVSSTETEAESELCLDRRNSDRQ